MLRNRILVILVMLPAVLAAVWRGGWVLTVAWAAALAVAAWEYAGMFANDGKKLSLGLLLPGTVVLVMSRKLWGLEGSLGVLTFLVLLSVALYLLVFERGDKQAVSKMTYTVFGLIYIGWLGAYLISLRELPSGLWLVLLTFISVWSADFGGYVFGIPFGKHKIAPGISPKKSWEGYIGGVILSLMAGYLFYVFVNPHDNSITLTLSLGMAGIIAICSLFGDLAESMLKRQTGVKDSGTLLPGHGGVFDRIDSWLWAVVIGFYLISWLHH